MEREEELFSFFGLGLMGNALLVFKDYFILSLKCERCVDMGLQENLLQRLKDAIKKGHCILFPIWIPA